MRLGSVRAFVASGMIAPCAFAQSSTHPTASQDPILAACPGVAAFVEREKAREAAMQPKLQAPPTRPGLAAELNDMYTRDQDARNALIKSPSASTSASVLAVDTDNLARFKNIISRFGFPTLAMVGREGVQHAWVLTQHADRDVAFQEQVLAVLEARPEGEIRLGDLAMLEDRVRVNEGLPQRYGGNFDMRTMQPTPIEDPEHVDERRAQMHLMPMADYRCMIKLLSSSLSGLTD
jgi:hypothetical protein